MEKSLSVREERLQEIVFMISPLATDLARKCLAHCAAREGCAVDGEATHLSLSLREPKQCTGVAGSLAACVEKGR